MPKLTADAVHTIAKRLLFKDEEIVDGKPPDNAVIVDGLINRYAFHRERAAAAAPEIDALLKELPEPFQRGKGGGWSFLNACVDKKGEQWGEHRDIEMLICLGIAVGSASWQMKNIMDVLPGGMPYVEVHPS